MSSLVAASPSLAPATMQRVSSPDEAREVSDFLLQPTLFGTPLTPGEREEFRLCPLASINHPQDAFWFFRDSAGKVCAVLGIRMHHYQTGIFEVVAMAVHSSARRLGLGRRLLDRAMDHVPRSGGRGLLFETSSHGSYEPMRHLLAECGFSQVGCFPGFYYPGEDTLWYFRDAQQ